MQKFYTQTSIYCYFNALASKEGFILKHLSITIVIFKKGSFISMYAKVLYSSIYLLLDTRKARGVAVQCQYSVLVL
jgi:hypothetical protein